MSCPDSRSFLRGKSSREKKKTHWKKTLLPADIRKPLFWFIRYGDFFIHRLAVSYVVLPVKAPFQVGQLLSILGLQCGGQMCHLFGTHWLVGNKIQRQTRTKYDFFSPFFQIWVTHLGTSLGFEDIWGPVMEETCLWWMLILCLHCAKPFPICYLIWSPSSSPPRTPCWSGIIIPILQMRKQKLSEAELLAQGHRDGKRQFLIWIQIQWHHWMVIWEAPC